MSLNADLGPAQAGATYTAWPLSELPQWMLADAPRPATWLVVREPGAAVGWIQAPCGCGSPECSLAAQFMRLVAVAHGQVSLQPATALVIYPEGAVTVAARRPGAAGDGWRLDVLGRHLIARAELTSTLTMWSGDATEPVNVAATDLARQYGYLWRRLHGPVMLCRAGCGAGWDLTVRQLLQLLAMPITLPRDRQPALAAAGTPGGR
jgi:hypothetical protein